MHLHCLGIQSTIQVNSAWPSHWDRQNAYWWKLGSKQASPVTTHCSSLCVVLRCKLVSGWGLRKWKVAPSSGHVAVEGIFYVQKGWQNISIHKSSQRRCLTAGPQMVAVNLQRHMRASRGQRQHHDRRRLWRLFSLYYGTIVAVSAMDSQMILWWYTTQTDYRVIAIYKMTACGTLSQWPWTWPGARSLQWNTIRRATALLSNMS